MQIGPYRILCELARGGAGVVYRAQGPEGRPVALKPLSADSDDDHGRKRFLVEVNALARLRHPHVISILAAGEHQGRAWLALELVEGQSLETRLRQGPLPLYEALRVGRQLAQALSYVHACGVCHRDLKPANVLLREAPDGPHAQLTDFGIARDDQASITRITRTGIVEGTPGYWAPEQALGQAGKHSPRTDLYGLGAVLYACLTGRPPIRAATLQQYVAIAAHQQPPSPRKLRPEVPEWVDALCRRCLARLPEDRPASATDVARELVVGNLLPPPSKHRILPVALAVGGVVLLAGGATWALGRPPAEPPAPRLTRETPSPAPKDPPPPQPPPDPDPHESDAPSFGPDPAALDRILQEARTQIRAGQLRAALDLSGRVLDLDPDYVEAYVVRTEAYVEAHDWEAGYAAAEAALQRDPEHPFAIRLRGICAQRLGRNAAALADYERALELGHVDTNTFLDRGNCLKALGRWDEALADYDQALAIDPRDRRAFMARGFAKVKLRDYAAGIADYDEAIRLDPESALAYHNRGFARMRLGQERAASEDFERALARGHGDPWTHTYLGVCRANLGDAEGALQAFSAALALDPNHVGALGNRGGLLGRLGRHEEALVDLARAAEHPQADPMTHHNHGVSLQALGHHAEALASFERAIQLGPTEQGGWLHLHRGLSREALGQLPGALADYEEALRHGLPAEQTAEIQRRRTALEAQLAE